MKRMLAALLALLMAVFPALAEEETFPARDALEMLVGLYNGFLEAFKDESGTPVFADLALDASNPAQEDRDSCMILCLATNIVYEFTSGDGEGIGSVQIAFEPENSAWQCAALSSQALVYLGDPSEEDAFERAQDLRQELIGQLSECIEAESPEDFTDEWYSGGERPRLMVHFQDLAELQRRFVGIFIDFPESLTVAQMQEGALDMLQDLAEM